MTNAYADLEKKLNKTRRELAKTIAERNRLADWLAGFVTLIDNGSFVNRGSVIHEKARACLLLDSDHDEVKI